MECHSEDGTRGQRLVHLLPMHCGPAHCLRQAERTVTNQCTSLTKTLSGQPLVRPARSSKKQAGGERKRSPMKAAGTASRMPDFIKPQLCVRVGRPPSGPDWAHEIKFDGYRCQLRVEDGNARLRSRKGGDWTENFGAIAHAAAQLPDAIIDGEIVALDARGAPDFPALPAALSAGNTKDVMFFAFDLLFDGQKDMRRRPFRERKARLKQLLAANAGQSGRSRKKVFHFVEHFETAGEAVLRSACKMALEGVVSKRLKAPYRSGRTKAWTKAECRGHRQVVIGGWTGAGDRVRSLLVGVNRGDHCVYIGRVVTGLSEAKVRKLLPRLKAAVAKGSPFTGGGPRNGADITWTCPELVAEIEFTGWTGDGLARHATFESLREDDPDNLRTEALHPAAGTDAPVRRIHSSAPAPRSRRAHKPDVMGVLISNPEKPLWVEGQDGRSITKFELAKYLDHVAPWLIEHIRGRPCSIVRAPNGVGGQQFFQRHAMPGTSSLLEVVTVFGDRKPYLEIDRVEGLAAVAQLAAVELHPWNCQPFLPETPGRLIFDLDPGPDVPFSMVVEAGREMRERLDALGLLSFCKTTGGKGLHVVTPLLLSKRRRLTWREAKAFAREVCIRMAQDSPQRYVVNMAKRLRGGRIFLDYLRNDRMATAVAPLSTRARTGATVSMPLTWAQVKADLDPRIFTIRTVPELIRKSKAWAGYCDAERPLEHAIRRLGEVRSAA
jgi:bifunctional non-homologous end joining protein LigD